MTRIPSPAIRAACLLALALGVAWTFHGVLDNESVLLDDPAYVFENGMVRGGLSAAGVRWAFTTGHATNWHPVTWLSHMLDVEVWGLDPRGHHGTSLLLHALNSVLVAWVLFRFTRLWWPSFVTALLFAVHPLRVESVAWIAERKDLCSVSFLLLTLLAWRRWIERPTKPRYVAVCVLYALGLMSKPMLVTVPLLLCCFDIWPLARATAVPLRARIVEKIPLFVLACASAVTTFAVQRAGGAMTSVERLPIDVRLVNALASTGRYLYMTVWPARLAVHYPHSERPDWTPALVSLALVTAITWFSWRARAQRPYFLVGWLWFLITLVPVIGVVQVGQQSLADRYTLIPHLGLLLALIVGVASACTATAHRIAASGVVAAIAVALSVVTHAQVQHWRSSRALFEHALAVTGDNAFVLMNLGNAEIQRGSFDAGIRHLERALELDPRSTQALNNLGGAYGVQGKLDRAIDCYQRSLTLDADQAEPHYNLGLAFGKKGAHATAIREFAAALEHDPAHYRALARWAMELAAEGDRRAAIPIAERALELARRAGEAEAAALLTRELASWRASVDRRAVPGTDPITR